jgi:hypothetical protein
VEFVVVGHDPTVFTAMIFAPAAPQQAAAVSAAGRGDLNKFNFSTDGFSIKLSF